MTDNKLLMQAIRRTNQLLERLCRTVDTLNTKVTTIEHCMPDGEIGVGQEKTINLKMQTLVKLNAAKAFSLPHKFPNWGYKEAEAFIVILDAEIRSAQDALNSEEE